MTTKIRSASIFQLLKSAIAGSEENFTTGSINKAIFLLSVPMILEMLMESLFAVVDIWFVSRVSVDAIATVGLTESVLTLVYSVAIGLSMAATAMVARRIGENDRVGASLAASQALWIGITLSIIISAVGFFFAEEILKLMGGSDSMIKSGANYTRWMFGGNITIMFLFLINGIFRGAGDASLAMQSLWLANGLNLVLDPLFIFGLGPIPAYGVEGAAIATNIGRGGGVLFQLYHLLKGSRKIRLLASHLHVQFKLIWKLLVISSGGTAQFLIASASWVFLFRIMAMFSDEAVAGYTIGIRIIIFTILPAWGMANAAATLVGQNLGAGEPERAERSVYRATLFNTCFLSLVAVVFLAFADQITGFFSSDVLVQEFARQCLFYVSFGYLFYGAGMVISQSFNGAGDTFTPTLLNIFGFWVIQIPLAYLLAVVWNYGPKGVFLAIPIAESVLALVALLVFRRGKWKKTKV